MKTLFVQNDKVFIQILMFSIKPLVEPKKVVIWWLFNDDLRAREREWEEKRTRNSAPKTVFIADLEKKLAENLEMNAECHVSC